MKQFTTKLSVALLALLLVASLFVSCTKGQTPAESTSTETETGTQPSSEPKPDTKLPINIAVLSGTTGYGMAKLMHESNAEQSVLNYQVSVESSAKIIQDSLIAGTLDIAALPTNKAAMIYNATGGKIQIAAVNTLGVMYLITANGETVNDLSDLQGKTVCIPEEPSYILIEVCRANGMEPGKDITIETYATPKDLLSAVIKGDVPYAVLPEPLLSTAMSKKDTIQIALDMTELWQKAHDGVQLMQGCIVVRTEWAQAHPLELQAFLSEYKASIDYVNKNPAAAAPMITEFFGTDAPVAEKAIPNCNLVYIDGKDMKDQLSAMYSYLLNIPESNIGGKLPDDGFYYSAD